MSAVIHALDLKDYQPDIEYILKKHKVTENEYWDKYYDYPEVTYEWNDGELEEKGVSDVATVLMYIRFLKLLEHYLETYPIAESMVLEMGFRLTLPQKDKVCRPDLGVVKNDNPIPLKLSDNNYQGTYDLCVEAISDSKLEYIKHDTKEKKAEYAKGGVKEYYILDAMIAIPLFIAAINGVFMCRSNPKKAEKQIEQAKKRAELLAQKLQALGIDPDDI